jgi:hypothetical protein
MAMKKAVAKRPAHMSEQFQPKGRSELPRLSAALASYLDASREEHQADYGDDDDYDDPENGQAEEEFRGSHSIAGPYRNDKGADIEDPVEEYDAEEMLQNYRQKRDSGQDNPSQREDIRNSYKWR